MQYDYSVSVDQGTNIRGFVADMKMLGVPDPKRDGNKRTIKFQAEPAAAALVRVIRGVKSFIPEPTNARGTFIE
jgi:hypothetical protein